MVQAVLVLISLQAPVALFPVTGGKSAENLSVRSLGKKFNCITVVVVVFRELLLNCLLNGRFGRGYKCHLKLSNSRSTGKFSIEPKCSAMQRADVASMAQSTDPERED